MIGWIKRLMARKTPEEEAKAILGEFSLMSPEARERWLQNVAAWTIKNVPKQERETVVRVMVALLRKEAVRAELQERERQAVASRLLRAANPEREP